jgi:hypothetical protein
VIPLDPVDHGHLEHLIIIDKIELFIDSSKMIFNDKPFSPGEPDSPLIPGKPLKYI